MKKTTHKQRKTHKKARNKHHVKRVHNYFHRTGFYVFVLDALKKAFWPIVFTVIAVFLFNEYVYDLRKGLVHMTETFSTWSIVTFFYASETILGLIPPEIFLGWASKMDSPYFYIALLATISYLGGLTAYFLGRASLKIASIKEYLEVKMAKNLKNTEKWGGILILVGALLPLPFAISCLTAGMIKYPFRNVVLYGLFRFIRFAFYGYLIFSAVN